MNIRKETEMEKLQLELLQDLVPKETITNYYTYGQASVLANLIEWVEDIKSTETMKSMSGFDMLDTLKQGLFYWLDSNEKLNQMTKRLLRDFDIDLDKIKK